MFRPFLLLNLVFLTVSGTAAAQDLPGCDCDRQEILASIRSADSIFTGRVVKASMESKDDTSIRIWVETLNVIRGAHLDTEAIVTARPEACGIHAGIGRHLLFIIPAEGSVVTRCSGSALPEMGDWFYLRLALTTVELWDSEPDAVRQELDRFGTETPRELLSGYFRLLEELDPGSQLQQTGNIVRYRNMIFEFGESTYTVRWEN